MKLWGGRFETGPSEVFERFSGSLDFDRRLIDADIRGSQAFARALERAGILTADEREQIVTAFDAVRAESLAPAFYEGASDEDVHTLVIRKLQERAGNVAGKIHTGRSRNEQVSLDTRLWLREECDRARGLLAAVMHALLELASQYPDAVIPGYTHMRRAQAVLWPHYLLAYFEMFARDWERFGDARRRADLLPLGSGALAGSGFPFDRDAIARDLGFAGITLNSMDVSGDRDFALDFLYAASVAMIHLSRLAEDWILYSSEEFGWLELGDGVTSGSSLMPQKKNPDSLELIRGKCGRVMGCAHLPDGHHEGPAHDLQSRHAGGQGAALRSRRPVGRFARDGARRDRERQTECRPAAQPRPKRVGWSPPISPKLWRAPARRSTRPTRLWDVSSWRVSARGTQAGRLDARRDAPIRTGIHRRFRGAARSQERHAIA